MSKYCFEVCPKGKEMKDYLLDNNNSVYDAVIDFKLFEKECVKTCDKMNYLRLKSQVSHSITLK